MPRTLLPAAFFLAFLAAIGTTPAWGTALPDVPAVASSGPPAGEQRLAVLTDFLDGEERRFETWRWGWVAGFAALAAANLAVAPALPKESRIDAWTGAACSAVALPPLFIFRQPDPSRCAASGPTENRLRCAEATLSAVARSQRAARSWPMHAVNIGFNLAVSAFLGLGYGRWRSAALNLGGGTLVGELQILTHPRSASVR
jgi:hypothetical protein